MLRFRCEILYFSIFTGWFETLCILSYSAFKQSSLSIHVSKFFALHKQRFITHIDTQTHTKVLASILVFFMFSVIGVETK